MFFICVCIFFILPISLILLKTSPKHREYILKTALNHSQNMSKTYPIHVLIIPSLRILRQSLTVVSTAAKFHVTKSPPYHPSGWVDVLESDLRSDAICVDPSGWVGVLESISFNHLPEVIVSRLSLLVKSRTRKCQGGWGGSPGRV